jgi:hypothetical protein
MEVSARENCGYPGISPEECASRQCCFSDVIPDVPWCFFPESVKGIVAVGPEMGDKSFMGGSRAGGGSCPKTSAQREVGPGVQQGPHQEGSTLVCTLPLPQASSKAAPEGFLQGQCLLGKVRASDVPSSVSAPP